MKLTIRGYLNNELVSPVGVIEVPDGFEVTEIEEFVGKDGHELFTKKYRAIEIWKSHDNEPECV